MYEKFKNSIRINLKNQISVKKDTSDKIIRINKIFFFDEYKKIILEKKISINFIKKLKIEIKNLSI